MTNAGHMEYLHMCEDAGFKGTHVELHVGSGSAVPKITIETFIKLSFNPLWPTIEEQMEKIFSREEREHLMKHMRPLYEGGNGISRGASVFISAFKATILELSVGTPW
jgi:ppGpp synthetase/RelA/SpoT-type nucleotidyltranferase